MAPSDAVLAACCALVIERGLDVTMDELAAASGVARRTLFRHYGSRETLVARAVALGIRRYGENLPEADGDWRAWLHDLCRSAHKMQARYGPGYWELTSRTDLPAEVRAVEADRRTARRRAMGRIAHRLWSRAGGPGDPPAEVVAGVSAHLSPRFTQAVVVEAGQPWRVAADLAEAAILDLLARTVPG